MQRSDCAGAFDSPFYRYLTSVRIKSDEAPLMTAIEQSDLPAFPPGTEDPGAIERARRFWTVLSLAARIYAGYKSTQLWTRYISKNNKDELYRRQDLRAARALYHTAISLEG